MTWHLVLCNPDKLVKAGIPQSHRLRKITHEEFGRLMPYLEIAKEEGQIIVNKPATTHILGRLAEDELEVRYDELLPDFIQRGESLSFLDEKDYALVFFPRLYGTYALYGYDEVDERKFRKLVDTAIIEPLDSKELIPIRILTIAKQLMSLDQRITQAKRLVDRPSEREGGFDGSNISTDDQDLEELLKDYEKERAELLRDPVLSETNVSEVITKYEESKSGAIKGRRRAQLTLQIEKDVEERWAERYRLEDSITSSDSKLDKYEEALESLVALHTELARRRLYCK